MTTKDNLAYDYSRFEEKDRAQIKALAAAPKPKKGMSVLRAVCYLLVAVAMLSMLIYTKVEQTELSKKYDNTVTMINYWKNENSRLEIQLQKELSPDNLEEVAKTELGLNKIRDQQIEYIEFEEKGQAEVIEQGSFWKDIVNWFKNLFR